MFRNILVSVDDSPQSKKALAQAIDLATESRGRLTILTAISTISCWAYTPSSAASVHALIPELEQEAQQLLDQAIATVPASIPLTSVLSREPIRKALVRELARERHDLLVMGSRRRMGLAAWLFGSVSHFALNRLAIPVLIVHDEELAKVHSAQPTRTMRLWRRRPVPQNSSEDLSSTVPS